MARALAYAPTFDEIFAEIDILFPDAPEAAPMTATFPTLHHFESRFEHHAHYLIRKFPDGRCMVVTDCDGSSLPVAGDWMACLYARDFELPDDTIGPCDYREPSHSWDHAHDFNGEAHFLGDLADEIADGATAERAALTIRQRSNTLSADDARALIAEDDAAIAPDPDFEAEMLRIIALHWAKEIGLGWHVDTRGADYAPALSAAQFATYDTDMSLLMRAADPYELALDAMAEAGLIASDPDPCPIHRQPVTRCPDSCEYHA